jgi:1-acyl-sn-glycerol-3-phosphate acyltransferase
MIRATLVYLFIALFLATVGPVGLVWSLATGRTAFLYRAARLCVRAAGWLGGIRVRIRGREKLEAGRTYLFLSNHQGNCDGPALLHAVPRDVRALIKKEAMQLPVLGRVMHRVQFVGVDRRDPDAARAAIERAARLLREGLSFIAFPEGTRSRTGELQPFKKGVFVMAIRAGAPVVPITIRRSRDVQAPGAFSIRPGTIDVVFHDPIETAALGVDDRDALVAATRDAIASALEPEAAARGAVSPAPASSP